MNAGKLRLDELLVARGLTESRAQAKALIMSGRVLRGTERLDKPGKEFPRDIELTIDQPTKAQASEMIDIVRNAIERTSR